MRFFLCLLSVWTLAALPAHAQALKWITTAVRTKTPTPKPGEKPADKPLCGEKQVDLKPVLVDEKPASSSEARKKNESEKPEPKKPTPVPKPAEKPTEKAPKKTEPARESVPAPESEKKETPAKKEPAAKESAAKEPPKKPAPEPPKKTVSSKKKEPVVARKESQAPKKAEPPKETVAQPAVEPPAEARKKPASELAPEPAPVAVVAPEKVAVKAQPVNPSGASALPPENPIPGAALFRPGDVFELRLSGMPAEDALPFALQFTIGTDGFVNIPLGGLVRGAGLTQSQLESAIEKRLVEREIFTRPTATINVAPQSRFVTVGGQVRVPQRLPWTADLTLLSAISAVGGPADFAGGKIKLTRAGKVEVFSKKDLDRRPEKDPRLLPGDQIEQL